MQALTADLELFSHIQDKDRKTYLAMVHRLDINVGKIIKALKDEGLEDNTIVVFLSDNGGPVDQNSSINLPLNGQKGILLEGGIRVPMIMVWPTKIKAGIMYHHPVSSLDLMPTFLAAADVAVQQSDQYDGVNLIPFLMSGTSQKPHKNIKWRFTISAAILEDNWKLIRLPDRLPYLFDLSSDISEKKNVALEHLDITKRLLQTLGVWDVSLPHPVFLEGAEWKIKQLMLYDKNYFDK